MRPNPPCGHAVLHSGCAQCAALQAYWYGQLTENGFEDAEDTTREYPLLKKWSGASTYTLPDRFSGHLRDVHALDLIPERRAISETISYSREQFLFHPEFDTLCKGIVRHGNHTGTTHQVRAIWEAYIHGGTNRSIAAALAINDTFVWRTIRALTQWMELMDLEAEQPKSIAKVVLRDFMPTVDEGFIYATWRNALWYDDAEREESYSDKFFRDATLSIRRILDNPKTRVRIACLSDGHDFIVGYSVVIGNCLHFVYVKADYRGKRIGSMLVPRAVETASPIMTKVGRVIAEKRGYTKQNKENQNG